MVRDWPLLPRIFVGYSIGGGNITSNSVTLPVSETAYSVAGVGTNTTTMTAGSGYTEDGLNREPTEYKIGAAQGSTTSSWTFSGNTSNEWAVMLFGFRPTTGGTAPARHALVRSQVYMAQRMTDPSLMRQPAG
jgi:hypothetical protein